MARSPDKTVLIVDGDLLTRRSLANQLKQRGCWVTEAGGLAEAQKAVQDGAVDVALLDLRSLREEALVLLSVIRNVHPDAQIILLSGPEHIGLCIRGMKQGAFDDLMIPVDVELLMSRILAARKWAEEKKNGHTAVASPRRRDEGKGNSNGVGKPR